MEVNEGRDEEERHFRDIASVLPAFDPVKDDLTVEEWIEKIEEYGDLYKWDDIAIRRYALGKLTGVARKWRDSLPSVQRSWKEWKELLQENFPSDKSTVSVRLEAQNYKKKPNQDMVEYFYEKLAKCNRAGMGDREAIEWIVDGLNSLRLRDYLGPLSRYRKPSELLTDLRGAAGARWKEATNVGEKSSSMGFHAERRLKCFSCKQQGHTARTCPKPAREVTCFRCGKTEHYSRVCQENTQQSRPTTMNSQEGAPARVLRIEGDTHQKYFKIALLNDRPVECYVDLGSSVTALREDVAHELGITYRETSLNSFVGYGEGRVQPLGIFTAGVNIDGAEVKTEIHVVPSRSQAVPLLVGHPYTEHPDIVVVSRAGELRIVRKSDDPLRSTPCPVTKTTLRASDAYVIPNNYLGHIVVAGTLPNQGLCVEGGLRERGPAVPSAEISRTV